MDNIRTDLREVDYDVRGWIDLAQKLDQCVAGQNLKLAGKKYFFSVTEVRVSTLLTLNRCLYFSNPRAGGVLSFRLGGVTPADP